MIILKKDSITMAVSTSVQAAAFLRNGWVVFGENEPMPKTEEQNYTKTIINRMSTSELQELAKEQGIENAEEATGAELKKVLIEKFGL